MRFGLLTIHFLMVLGRSQLVRPSADFVANSPSKSVGIHSSFVLVIDGDTAVKVARVLEVKYPFMHSPHNLSKSTWLRWAQEHGLMSFAYVSFHHNDNVAWFGCLNLAKTTRGVCFGDIAHRALCDG